MSQFAAQGSAGMLQQANQGLGGIPTTWNTTATTATSPNNPYYTQVYPNSVPNPVETPDAVEVPVISKHDRAGIFLRDDAGNLVHVETSKLFKAFGLEW